LPISIEDLSDPGDLGSWVQVHEEAARIDGDRCLVLVARTSAFLTGAKPWTATAVDMTRRDENGKFLLRFVRADDSVSAAGEGISLMRALIAERPAFESVLRQEAAGESVA